MKLEEFKAICEKDFEGYMTNWFDIRFFIVTGLEIESEHDGNLWRLGR